MKRNIFGLLFNPKTGKVTFEDGEVPTVGADFTFEDHEGYNPLQYATEKTAEAVADLLKKAFPSDVSVKTAKTKPEGPVQPPASWQIEVSRFGISESFNAGLIANSLIRSGSLNSFKADLKTAGILF